MTACMKVYAVFKGTVRNGNAWFICEQRLKVSNPPCVTLPPFPVPEVPSDLVFTLSIQMELILARISLSCPLWSTSWAPFELCFSAAALA